jgi:histidine triad (HIT) family protein
MFNHAPKNYNCPFCLIVRGIENEYVYSVQTDIIYQNQWVTALINSHQWPNNLGSVIIVSNEHYENIYDLPVHYALKIHAVAKAVALAMKLAFVCDGVSTRQHNEPAGNQDVWHYHLHVTPRYEDDRFYSTQRRFMPANERVRYAQKLRDYLVTRN